MSGQRWIQFHDEQADELGRRQFTLFWLREGGLPGTASTFSFMGTRRAQVFFCDPTPYESATVVTCAPWEAA